MSNIDRNQTAEDAVLATVASLCDLSRNDWLYADLYLQRAEALLAPVCSRDHFQAIAAEQEQRPRLVSDLRRALEQGHWGEAQRLAEAGAALRRDTGRRSRLFEVAKPIYGPRRLEPGNVVLALTGAIAAPAEALESQIQGLVAKLRRLASEDAARGTFYAARADHFEGLAVVSHDAASAVLDPSQIRERMLRATDAGNFDEVLNLATLARSSRQERTGRIRAPVASRPQLARLAMEIPAEAVRAATHLGFAACSLAPDEDLNRYLTCGCGERVRLPEVPLREGHRGAEVDTCGHACPPQLRASLKSNLDLLLVHPFLSSGGSRYLPWFGAETLLVETFPESEPNPPDDLLNLLGLDRRRGLSRFAIEDALLTRGPTVCREIGLDPVEFRLVCVPFDVYARLASVYGWGREETWTQFDGYQVTRELRLLALVGGDVRFGGPDDLCSVARDYAADRIPARFAIVRRNRFTAREPGEHREPVG